MSRVHHQFGLIGQPVKHSFSPLLFREVSKYENLPLRYLSWEIAPSYLEDFLNWLRSSCILGINVTLPFKERILSYLDEVDPTARSIGAVNVVKKIGQKLHGYNSDWYGFLEAIKRLNFWPKKMLIFGGGGAARSVLYAAKMLGCQKATVVERSPSRRLSLKKDFSFFFNVQVIGWEESLVEKEIEEADLVVNATPLGLPGISDSFPLNFSVSGRGKLFFDLIYKFETTPFMKMGLEKGARCANGLDMLLFQALKSLEIWTGQKTSYQSWLKAYHKISQKKNLCSTSVKE
ncbi:MAG: shikimate dehydrogenase family protein [Candidatus Saccharicenans sp.]